MKHTKITILIFLLLFPIGIQAQRKKSKGRTRAVQVQVIESPAELLLKSMLPATAKVMFIDSLVVDKKSFLSKIPISKENGEIMTSEAFLGKKSQVFATAYKNEFGDRAYFAQGDTIHGTKLFAVDKWGDSWDQPYLLSEINSECSNPNYPFMMTDGITMFFSAEGDNSIGGRDIFMTLLDTETGKFYKPENYGMPFNSTANDYLVAFDEYHELGWLVSDRFLPNDKVCIYTFVPTTQRVSFESDNIDEEKLKSFAFLKSIRETWTFGNRDEALKRLHTMNNLNVSLQKENECFFPMNDKIVYRSISNFTSPQAKLLFKQYQELNADLVQIEQELDAERKTFHNSPAHLQKTKRSALLKKEQQALMLQKEVKDLEKKIRNTR